MLKSVKSKAEEQFAAAQKKDKEARDEKEIEHSKKMAHVANLRALRLAKEAADRKVAEKEAAEKAAEKAAIAEKSAAKKAASKKK